MPVFRRQVLVLQHAHTHAVMFINRPFLLNDSHPSPVAESCVLACLTAAKDTLDSFVRAVQEGTAFNAFWFTQYVAFSAISIVYVWVIQRGRGRLSACGVPYQDEHLLQLAEDIQGHLAMATQTNAPTLRYSAVLAELQQEARRIAPRAAPQPCSIYHTPASAGFAEHSTAESSAPSAMSTETPNLIETTETDALSWDALGRDLPLDPDLWMQLDAFPFSESQYKQMPRFG